MHVPDAALGLLDQLTPETAALVDEQVRLVISTRPAVVAALEGPSAEVVAAALVRLGDPDDEAGPGDDVLVGAPATTQALVRTVADLDRYGLVTHGEAAPSLVTAYGVPEDHLASARRTGKAWRAAGRALIGRHDRPRYSVHPSRSYLRTLFAALRVALQTTARFGRLRWAIADARRRGLLRRGRGPLRPTIQVIDGTRHEGMRRTLAGRPSGSGAILRAARMALARDEAELALLLFGRLTPDAVPVGLAARVAGLADDRFGRGVALEWYVSVGRRAEGEVARLARRTVALSGVAAAYDGIYAWLSEAGEVESDREVQHALAVRARACDDGEQLRHRYRLVARGDDARAREAAWELALLALDDGQDDDAERLLRRVLSDPRYDILAPVALVRLLRRLGRAAEAEALASREFEDPRARAAVARELAAVRAAAGEIDDAVGLLRTASARIENGQALAAAVELAELEATRGNWTAVAEAFPDEVPHLPAPRQRDLVLDDVDVPAMIARGYTMLGEAAWRSRDARQARRYLEQVERRGRSRGLAALRLGQMAAAQGRIRDAKKLLDEAAESGDQTVSTSAWKVLEDLGPDLAALARQEAAVLQAARSAAFLI